MAHANLHAGNGAVKGVAIREFPLNPDHGFADCLLYVNGKDCGVIEAKKAGASSGRATQEPAAIYANTGTFFPRQQHMPPLVTEWGQLKSFVGHGGTVGETDALARRPEEAKVIQVVGDWVRYL